MPGQPYRKSAGRSENESYAKAATRPLYSILFLLPLIIWYEYGSLTFLADKSRGIEETIGAHSILLGLFRDLGEFGRFIPAALLLVVFLMWHIFRRDPWMAKPMVLVGMLAEAALWTLPMWVFSLIVPLTPNGVALPAAAMQSGSLLDLTWQARATLSAGAGLYEELLFRVLIITAMHFVVVDLLRQSSGVGYVIGAIVSAVSFALYHNISMPSGGVHLGLFVFYTAAGVYFSVLFIQRGFGIAAMTHTLYDIVVLIIQPGLGNSSEG